MGVTDGEGVREEGSREGRYYSIVTTIKNANELRAATVSLA